SASNAAMSPARMRSAHARSSASVLTSSEEVSGLSAKLVLSGIDGNPAAAYDISVRAIVTRRKIPAVKRGVAFTLKIGRASIKQTPDTHQKPPTDLLPARQGLASRVHSTFRISDSTMRCEYTADAPSETKQITGVPLPFETHHYRLRAALVFLLSIHPAVRLPGLTTAPVRLEFVFPDCEALHRAPL